ncbi:19264_t:CDS:2, partial [Gigaspora rosea]
LQKEFPDHEIYLSEIHKVTKKFYYEKRKDISNDVASLYENLLRRKDEDLHWYIAINWDRETYTESLEANIDEERNKSKNIYWKTQIPLTSAVVILPQALFPEIDKALNCFLTPAMLKVQRVKIKSWLNYQAIAITKAELIKYQE